ncbi:MAG TPA: XdhC family protein [Oscillatoriaceae cyanobacterium M33_DOE_052]|uniref:XdhC/CoxI family protein n=1 Tax=Planktothricoides sp. SpSt-374 TaxID=2282167 RepID=A0A7C3ZM48_9CYAN|nr:XdhC family protein [Oscillatoriaceae cyanobacterium M33_DOE_052]
MKDLLDGIEKWLNQGRAVAVATLVSVKGSSPREVGAAMAVNDAGEVLGSISGGCVEGALVDEALDAIAQSKPRLVSYGIADDEGFSIGLTCGGTIYVFVTPLWGAGDLGGRGAGEMFDAIRNSSQNPVAVCTAVAGPNAGAQMLVWEGGNVLGSIGDAELDRVVVRDARGELAQGQKQLRYYSLIEGSGYCAVPPDHSSDESEVNIAVFINSFAPPPHLIIFGAVDFTRSLCQLGKMLGYRVTVCDARSRFATKERFPEADEVVAEWPQKYLEKTQVSERTVIAVLTHDPKFDVPALVTAVKTNAGYIGAMGSRRTTSDRLRRLQKAGLTDREINRISAPIGLDIGATTPAETAVSIMAEVIALRTGRQGERLAHSQNTIHPILGDGVTG